MSRSVARSDGVNRLPFSFAKFMSNVAVVASWAVFSPYAQATHGYIPNGFGAASNGMAGAGSAFPQDTLTAYSNPAGMVKLRRRMDPGLELFFPNREYRANADFDPPPAPSVPPGTESSENDVFFIPSFGVNWRLDDKSSIALTLVGHGGMNTEYNTSTFERFAPPPGIPPNDTGELTAGEPTGIDLAQLVSGLTYARQITARHALGITPLFAVQRLKARGLQPFRNPFFTVSPDKVTNNGYDYSYGGGVRIGWLGRLHERLDVGVSYQTRLWMTRFDDYEGLLADKGEFDIPPILNIGFALRITPRITLVGDYQRIFYNQIDAVSNENDVSPQEIGLDPDLRLGGDDGLGFGWGDVDIWKIGLQWDINSKWTVRTGFSHGEEPWDGPNTLFNVLAPATIEDHASLGFTYNLNSNSAIVFAYTHAFKNTIKGTSQFTGNQTGHVRMHQHDVHLSWGYQF